MGKQGPLCVICAERPADGGFLCRLCARSYDRDLGRDGSVAAALIWAARRARRFERARRTR